MGDVYPVSPRMRVITDNDYGGDPDGLVQLAQLLLSPSVEVSVVIGSHLGAGDPFDPTAVTADNAAARARHVVELCGRTGDVGVVPGSNAALSDRWTPIPSAGAEAIVSEARRDDTTLPLYVTCGGGLTEIASAWLMDPQIAEHLTVVWIGGHEHDELAEPPPGGVDLEYNTAIDPVAAQVVFDESNLAVWQVPRDVYRTTMASRAEMAVRMAPQGALGRHLFESLASVSATAADHGAPMGETYILGDTALVLLTALQSAFEPAPASSSHVTIPCPRILDSGLYEPRRDGRPLRVYTQLDNTLAMEDLWAKLALHAADHKGEPN